MIWERIQNNWASYKVAAGQHWDRLGNDDLEQVAGVRERLGGGVARGYGIPLDHAEQHVKGWENDVTQNWFERSV